MTEAVNEATKPPPPPTWLERLGRVISEFFRVLGLIVSVVLIALLIAGYFYLTR